MMTEIEIRSVAHVKELFGQKSMKYTFEGNLTVFELLDELDARFGLGKLIYNPDKSMSDDVRVLLRGRDIKFLAEKLLKLCDGDIVLILPRLAGG